MREFFETIKRKIVFYVITAMTIATLVPSVAYAYDYYGGTANHHVSPGSSYNAIAPGNSRTTLYYRVDIIVRRGVPGHFGGNTTISETRVKNYTGDTNNSEKFSDWGYSDYKNSWNHWKNPYGEANGFSYDDDKVVNTLPAMWSNLHLGNDGVVYYDCPNCGAKAYYVDFVQYGYYDKTLHVRYTGYSGYQFCPTCNKGDEANTGKRGVKVGNTTIGQQVGSYEGPASSSNSFQGIYTYPEIKNKHDKYLITTDPAYAGLGYTTTYASWLQMLSEKRYNVSLGNNVYAEGNGSISYIDASRNGYWIKNGGNGKIHILSGGTTSNPGKDVNLRSIGGSYNVKIAEVKGNNQNIDFGQHFFKKYYSQIYFTAWNLSSHGECIHMSKYDNIYGPLYYNGKSIGKGGWDYVNDLGRCGHKYEKGYIGICADCGEGVTGLVYASPETLASFRQVENGVEYYYFCPAQIGNFNLGGKIFYYLHSQVENQWPFMHACYAVSKNQYQLKFIPNLPLGVTGDAWEYTLDKYFYNIFTNGTDVEYVANDVTVPYGESVPTVKSRNSIPSPTWDVPGFKFSGWEVYVGNNNLGREVWVALPTNKQTWQEVCNILENNKGALGNVYNSLINDMATIKLRATWEGYNRNVYIRDESESGAILNASNPYVVGYRKSQIISALGNKSGTLTCVQSGDMPEISLSNVEITTSKPFDSFRKATTPAFYGSFDKLSSRYTNDVLNRDDVYLVSEYHWESVVLPTPSLQKGYMFMGWYTGKNGTGAFVGNGGASYTPSSANETLYAYWKEDTMTIGAVVTNHTAGRSNVSWTYSNATVNGTAYYKIYRTDNGSSTWNLITNGNTIGNNVSTTSVNETKTADGSYTVVTDGLYSIEIQGAKGGNGNGTKSGGNGGKVKLTVMLKAGDVLSYNVANNHYNSNGSFSNGGNTNYCGGAATAIYLNNQLLAVAGGGGAASNSVNGGVGGTAISGTGNYYGTNSHSHAAGGGSSEWNSTYGTVYSSPGGCYTRGVTVGTQVKCTGTPTQTFYPYSNPYTENSGYADHNAHATGYYVGEIRCSNYANCGKEYSPGNVRCSCDLITAGDGKDERKSLADYYYDHYIGSVKTMYALRTDCNEYAGSGGYSYVNTSLATSNSVTGGTNSSTTGSVNIKSVVIGVTTNESFTDENTDDKIGPSAPTIETFTLTTNVNSSNSSRVDVVTDIVEWTSAVDRGTPYSYKGETWDIRSMETQTAVCATTQNANVTVTSGIESYYYKIDTNPTASNNSSGWTRFDGTMLKNTVSVDINQNPNAKYNKNFYLHVYAVDKAGNKGEVADKLCPMSWDITPPPSLDKLHMVGIFESVSISIPSIGNGSYIDNSVSPARVYLKADGITSLRICGNASLLPENASRITTITVGTGLRNGFTFECPLRDYQKNSAMVNGNVTSTFRSTGNEVIQTFDTENNKNSVSYYADFTTTSENETTVTAYAQAKCLSDGNSCAKEEHILSKTGNSYVLVGDKKAPTVSINGQSFQGENAGEYNYDWNSGKTISISSIDTGSGIKSIVVTDSLSGNTIANKNYSARVTTDTTSFSSTTSGGYSYEVVVTDNVGNKTIFKINEKIDNDNPYIKDVTSDISSSKVYASITSTWPTTNKNTSWEYDWFSSEKWISYNAYDMTSDMKSFKMYRSDASKTKGTLLKEGVKKEDVLGLQIDYKVTTEGTSYYLLEAIDSNNHVVTVHLTVRVDTFIPSGIASHTSISLEDKTPEEATSIVNGNTGSDTLTSIIWNVTWDDFSNASKTAKDSSGIIKSELYIYDENNPSIVKKYDMNVSSYGDRTAQSTSKWNPTNRYFEVSYSKQVNTFVDFPTSGSLKWRIVGYDNVGHSCIIEGPDVIKNYLVKAVAYATKDNGYNISTDNGNLPYFKTGEVGYVEVWTIGYVEKLELDFSDGGIGQEAADAISNGSLQKKYNLGVKGDSNNERIIANLHSHKPTSNTVPDNAEGYAYASHYVYAASDVNNSLGTDKTDGWNEYGTMIRIPPNHLLVKKDKTDKYGNALYNWETHEIGVIAHKKGSSSTTKARYVIWDEAGDDLHYRITHETFGF